MNGCPKCARLGTSLFGVPKSIMCFHSSRCVIELLLELRSGEHDPSLFLVSLLHVSFVILARSDTPISAVKSRLGEFRARTRTSRREYIGGIGDGISFSKRSL